MPLTARELLADATYTRAQVDRFLDPNQPDWALFDPELGYRLRSSVMKDGMDGCYTIAHYRPGGERRMINYADKPCRINTYGDSFTQCHQVSDGETWQEYLAAHFGEPVRNFGIGGYGVYQAYLRMLREEATASAAKYIILNIWDDDHFRNLDVWRWMRIVEWRKWIGTTTGRMFHANPWAHLRLDPDTGEVVARQNPFSTPGSLYQLCDKEYVYETFKDDLTVQIVLAQQKGTLNYLTELERLAETLGIPADFATPEARQETVQAIYRACALRTSEWIVEQTVAFARKTGKELMVFLTYSTLNTIAACEGRPRFDQAFVDFLERKQIPFVDVWKAHVEEFKTFNLSPQAYAKRYYIGHYNPRGNHFLAFAVKDALLQWLQPKPITYRGAEESQFVLAAALA